jgi:hypothetical protein
LHSPRFSYVDDITGAVEAAAIDLLEDEPPAVLAQAA